MNPFLLQVAFSHLTSRSTTDMDFDAIKTHSKHDTDVGLALQIKFVFINVNTFSNKKKTV